MKSKKIILLIIILIISIFAAIITYVYINKSIADSNKIPDGYIAIFHGGSGEIIFETYIYKKDNGQANSEFDYINVTKTTVSWGSSKWNTKITKRGSVQWTDDVFEVAKENHAYSYVTLPNSNNKYTIEEYMNMFLMD